MKITRLGHVAFKIGVEVYVDVSDAWRREPQRIAPAKPFDL